MGMSSDFKSFALRGNVVDLAVGVIIGAAFARIIDSVVNDLVMPMVGKALGNLDFSNYFLPLSGQPAGLTLAEARKLGAVLAWGNFVTVAVNFLLLALVIFLVVRQISRLQAKTPPTPVAPQEDVQLLREIRDALRA